MLKLVLGYIGCRFALIFDAGNKYNIIFDHTLLKSILKSLQRSKCVCNRYCTFYLSGMQYNLFLLFFHVLKFCHLGSIWD